MKTNNPMLRSTDDDTVGGTACAARETPSAKLRHVGGPQPEARQQEQDRTVTSARTGVAVTGSNHSVDLLGRQIPGHVGKLPMGVGRNGAVDPHLDEGEALIFGNGAGIALAQRADPPLRIIWMI